MHLFGKASVINDLAKKKALYTPFPRTWFPEGLDDPPMTMIRFDADPGDFRDSPGGFTKAIVTGTRGQGGEMGEVKL